jgi:hypothetical protein
MHECALCSAGIKYGEQYKDGGLDRRAHIQCIDDANTKLIEKGF